jgi:hypothetical protein
VLSLVWAASLLVKERAVVRIRDLSIAGRVTFLRWRKRRFWCEGCERTFCETHSALPSRQRVSARFRAYVFERCRGGCAHVEVARDESTARYQVVKAFVVAGDELLLGRENSPRRGAGRSMKRIIGGVGSSRQPSLI